MDKPRIVVNTKLTRQCLLSFASIRIDKIQINACIQDFECLTLIGHMLLSNRQARAQSSNTGGRKTALIKITYIIEACKPDILPQRMELRDPGVAKRPSEASLKTQETSDGGPA